MRDVFPDEFWAVYDKAREKAERDPYWNQAETERLYALDQANVSDEFEEILYMANEHQMSILIYELYKLIAPDNNR